MLRVALALAGGLILAPMAVPAPSADIARGREHYLNRDFELAAAVAERAIAERPEGLDGHLLLARARLYAELARRGLVGTRAFRGDKPYASRPRPKPDPAAARAVLNVLERAISVARKRVALDAADVSALHALAQAQALLAVHRLMIERAFFRGLATGRAARSTSRQLGALRPEFHEGLLVAGIYEYGVGSLPWAAKAIVAISGHRGRNKLGLELIARAAEHGQGLRDEARLVLALALRRARSYARAADLFRALSRRYRRAYTYQMESADLYESAGRLSVALSEFRSVRRKREQAIDGFERIAPAMAEALDRRIAALERAVRDPL